MTDISHLSYQGRDVTTGITIPETDAQAGILNMAEPYLTLSDTHLTPPAVLWRMATPAQGERQVRQTSVARSPVGTGSDKATRPVMMAIQTMETAATGIVLWSLASDARVVVRERQVHTYLMCARPV